MADKYDPVFTVQLGQQRALVVGNSETAKECFPINDASVSSGPKQASLKHIGYGHAMLGLAPYRIVELPDIYVGLQKSNHL